MAIPRKDKVGIILCKRKNCLINWWKYENQVVKLGCFRKPFKICTEEDEYDEVSLIYLDIFQEEDFIKLKLLATILLGNFSKKK